MNIYYIEPLKQAWNRMKLALFRPFDLSKWLVLGFTAWLAYLGSGGFGGSFPHPGKGIHRNFEDAYDQISSIARQAWEWLMYNRGWLILIIFGVVVLMGIGIVLLWLNSRGKFMFLDNVAKSRAEVKLPWNQFKHLGDSLFLWRLAFGIISMVVMLILGGLFFLLFMSFFRGGHPLVLPILFTVILGLISVGIAFCFVYISLFLENFVIQVMYKYNMTAMQAWRKFLALFYQNLGSFLLYGLFILGLGIAVGICIVIAGCVTCCCGFILISIPYIGAVILLPITYTYRALSIEFFAQFGPDYSLSL